MAVFLSPVLNGQIVDDNGKPATGWTIRSYAANSSTPLATYTDAIGNVPNDLPIIINQLGYNPQGDIRLSGGLQYKLTLSDQNNNIRKVWDYVSGVGDNAATNSQWVPSGVSPTYTSATTFTLPGDQTTEFHPGRRIQLQTTAGTVYGKIISSVFTSLTTITLVMDSGQALDTGLSSVNLSILRADNSALPNPIEYMRSTVAATATSTPLWSRAYGEVQDWTGSPTITDFPVAPRSGATRRAYPAAGTVITNGGNLSVQGNANYTITAGDEIIITAVTITTFYITIKRKDGLSVAPGFPAGAIIDFGGTVAPAGFLACPLVQTNISRATYPSLFAAIGTTWGLGDGSTTFGMPWFPADYVSVQANANVGTNTTGEVKAHTHTAGNSNSMQGGSNVTRTTDVGNVLTSSTGGPANLAAGVRVLKIVKL